MVLKRSLLFSWVLIGTVAVYSTFVEPVWLQISSYEISANLRNEITIAHLTDLHLHKIGIIERKILNILNAKRPDLVLITGDTLDGPQSISAVMKFFGELNRPRLGVWAVLGNWEHWSGNATRKLFHSFGVQLLINEGIGISNELTVFGFDDSLSGKPERALASEVDSRKVFCIEMIHSPQLADEIVHRCPLILAGHTHGGQVRLPLLLPFGFPKGVASTSQDGTTFQMLKCTSVAESGPPSYLFGFSQDPKLFFSRLGVDIESDCLHCFSVAAYPASRFM